jgi:hypothetical protein
VALGVAVVALQAGGSGDPDGGGEAGLAGHAVEGSRPTGRPRCCAHRRRRTAAGRAPRPPPPPALRAASSCLPAWRCHRGCRTAPAWRCCRARTRPAAASAAAAFAAAAAAAAAPRRSHSLWWSQRR